MSEHDPQEIKPSWFKRPILRPVSDFEHEAVRHVQRVLRCPETGEMDEATMVHIRGLQQLFNLRVTGMIDEATALQVDRLRSMYG